MTQTRRAFISRAAGAAGVVTLLPFAARASDVFPTQAGDIVVHPVAHASFVMETPAGTIYADPVGDPAAYAGFPAPDLVLVTHEHGDHYDAETLAALVAPGTKILANPAVHGMLPAALQAQAEAIGNGGTVAFGGAEIAAIPAYNTTEGRTNFHPEGRDNGYVLTLGEFRVYISGDTEDIPEMRALQDIDLAFLCMNLPFTMDKEQAASAVAEFRPAFVYPYHFRGRDGGTQDPEAFAALVGDGTEVRIANWYPNGLG